MKYDDPRLRAILAGEYVLGTMPPRARVRCERMMRFDGELVRLVGDWSDRFSAIDDIVVAERPPRRVWAAIDARTRPRRVKDALRPRKSFAWSFVPWAVITVLLAFLFNLFEPAQGPAPTTTVVAVLSDKDGEPAWVVSEDKGRTALSVEAVRAQPIDVQHAFELWAIADGKPVPLGLIAPLPRKRVTIAAASMPKEGKLLAVSLEPPGGSPTGLPTGPVLYKGSVLTD